ncbi:MAG: TVP38/TMEM64 family protein [SAR324 cluster bacterium]|uniref:TVP38/TMEM64 family membrane protein n=1 Tax=SAR324 cluster bacterium TaxID=2024889 RepID=A0A2A4T1Q7_9DELT|nr:MAG: TVP38/TMEM64 family protein [SAR324 cluster bacterium]
MGKKIAVLGAVVALVATFFYFDAGQYLSLESLKENKDHLTSFYQENLVTALLIYFVLYVTTTALSFPGATILTLAGGAIFGRLFGVIAVSFASTIGATLAFLMARVLLGESLQKKYGKRLKVINEGIEKDGVLYLLSLRLLPIFPFFVVNLLMGVTRMPLWKYFFISQIGMLPGTFVYVNAGTVLGEINSLQDILSPKMFLSFALLGLFPLIIKGVMKLVKKNKPAEDLVSTSPDT